MIASFRGYYRPVCTVSKVKQSTSIGKQLFAEIVLSITRLRKHKNAATLIAAFLNQDHRVNQLRNCNLGSITGSVSSDKALPVNLSKITEPGLLKVMRPLRVVTATMFGVTLTRLYSVLVTLIKSGL